MIIIKRKIKILLFIAAFLVISPLVILYASGDILGDGWSILKTGGIYISGAPTGSTIYFNGKEKSQTSFFERTILIKNLRAGAYDIRVEKAGYNTWEKKIAVTDNFVSEANVFMLPSHVMLAPILRYLPATSSSTAASQKKNQEYTDVSLLFSSSSPVILKTIATTTKISKSAIGTKAFPIISGNMGLWKDGSKIFVGWLGDNDEAPKFLCVMASCTEPLLVDTLPAAPRRINFLPGFPDAVIVSLGASIFAVQMEDNPAKMPQPIYTGIAPDFRVFEGSVYIKDGDKFFEAKL